MDIEKLLELKPLPIEESKQDMFQIVEASMEDLYPKVPDPDMDYLFTNWGSKVPEEKFVDAQKKEPDETILDKGLKKRKNNILDLSDEEKDVVEKVLQNEDASVKRLKDKGWEKWNESDWKDAKRKTRKPSSENIKELIDLSKEIQGESVRTRSSALVEMKMLDTLYKSIMVAKHEDPHKEEGKEQIYKKIDHIVDETLKPFKLKATSPKKYDEDDVMGIKYELKIGGVEYAIHTHLVKGSKIFLFSLWDKEEYSILLMLCEGYLKENHYLIGLGKSRIKSWMRDKHGTNHSE